MRIQSAFGLTALAMLLACPALPCAAQESPQASVARAAEEAQRSLQALRQLTTPETFKGLGFQSPDEVLEAQLDSPLPVFMVPLNRLKEYQPGADPNSLLDDTRHLIYPVTVKGQLRSGLTLRELNGEWQVASFGKPTLTRALIEARTAQMTESKSPAQAFFAVEIPALHDYFIARRSEGNLFLTPAITDPAHNLTAARTLDARQVFATLALAARELRTGPFISD